MSAVVKYLAAISFSKRDKKCILLGLDEKLNGVCTKECILDTLPAASQGYKTLNYSIVNGEVLQDNGSFTRFDNCDFIVIAQLVSHRGSVLGYRFYNVKTGALANFPVKQVKDFIKSCDIGAQLFQNAIIRNDALCAYPNKPFISIPWFTKTRERAEKPAEQKPVKKNGSSPMNRYTPEQIREMYQCREDGIDTSLISDPNLSRQQMRILRIAKKNGALAEHFNSAKYSPEVMKFYADRLVDEDLVLQCRDLLSHPELSVKQLTNLMDCIYAGVPYQDLLESTPEEIYLARLERDKGLWTSFKKVDATEKERICDTELLDKAMFSAMQVRS